MKVFIFAGMIGGFVFLGVAADFSPSRVIWMGLSGFWFSGAIVEIIEAAKK